MNRSLWSAALAVGGAVAAVAAQQAPPVDAIPAVLQAYKPVTRNG